MNNQDRSSLQVSGVVKRFGGIKAVQHVSFTVPARAIVALIGPNGAGKTTLFNFISGFQRADEGNVQFDGQEITHWTPERVASAGVIRTFQLVRLFNQMTALENVLVGFHLRTRGNALSAVIRSEWLRDQERRIRGDAKKLLVAVGLGQAADVAARNLTYGQQRLLEIARAL